MDTSRFDQWVRLLTNAASPRRTIFTLLVGGAALAAGGAGTEAKKRRKRKNKKKRCPADTRKRGTACIPADTCCSDADCEDPLTCIGGTCAVPCGQACADIGGICATSVDGAEVCAAPFITKFVCAAAPCTSERQCADTEFCGAVGCPPVGGVTNRCQALQQP